MIKERISISGNVLFGKPHIKGTRISIEQILGCLAQGWNYKEIIKEFDIEEGDIKACIDFAYHSVSRTHFVRPFSETSYA